MHKKEENILPPNGIPNIVSNNTKMNRITYNYQFHTSTNINIGLCNLKLRVNVIECFPNTLLVILKNTYLLLFIDIDNLHFLAYNKNKRSKNE